jgi:hypothetical protein
MTVAAGPSEPKGFTGQNGGWPSPTGGGGIRRKWLGPPVALGWEMRRILGQNKNRKFWGLGIVF